MPADFKPFDKAEWLRLEKKADELRRLTVQTTVWGGSGHIGGRHECHGRHDHSLSPLYEAGCKQPGHGGQRSLCALQGACGCGLWPGDLRLRLYAVEGLHNFNLTGSKFGMHLDKNKIKGIDCSSGSLGHGLSLADGFALAGRVKGQDYMVYCLTGDGELNEGSNWEAAMTAAQFKLSNVVVLVDNNKCMIDGRVDDEMKVEPLDKKFEAFGFKVKRVDGQNMKELNDAIEDAIANHKNGGDQPYCIVMDTFKGAGIDFMEDDYHWHYGALDEAKEKACYESLDKYYKKRCERAEKEG